MSQLQQKIIAFVRDEDGLTIVEYAVAGGLITVAVVASFIALGSAVNNVITSITSAVNGTAPA